MVDQTNRSAFRSSNERPGGSGSSGMIETNFDVPVSRLQSQIGTLEGDVVLIQKHPTTGKLMVWSNKTEDQASDLLTKIPNLQYADRQPA